jgi:predicted AAA+ superfamily ATPase
VAELRPPVVLDEIQNAPELFGYVRTRIDLGPRRAGQWLLTGSQEWSLMRGVSESMAGRAAVLRLLPFGSEESAKATWTRGGFPEAVLRPARAARWFASYVQTYLERDVRQVLAVRDLTTFRRFLALLASRAGRLLNRTDLAGPLGVSIPTVSEWLSVLETTGHVILVPPYFENVGKRLTKSPRIHFTDSGLLLHLLGLARETDVLRSPFAGPVFEGYVASEVVKAQVHRGGRGEVYGFRDQHGLEVNLVVPLGGNRLALVEAKSSRTVRPGDASSLLRVAALLSRHEVSCYVVHRTGPRDPATTALVPGVQALGVPELLRRLFPDRATAARPPAPA